MVDTTDVINCLINHSSSLYKLKRLMSWLLRFKNFLISKVRHSRFRFDSELTVDELNAAERALIRYVQRQHFPFLTDLKSKNKAKTFPRYMQKLQPIEIDSIIRVRGRLEKTVVKFDVKHPIIRPQKCHFSQLAIRQYHVEMGHSGTSHTWASVKEKFWIVKGGSAVRHVIGQCIACRKRNAKIGEQFMADLPSCRLQSFERPFYNTGTDYFGPFMIKQGRSLVKRYGCMFTCLTMRAVYIEIANSDSRSFINALRQFTAHRGKPNCIFSDNGKNFVDAARILRESLEELNKDRIDRYCCQQNIKWVFMPPSASHMGGAWECMICSIRKILNALIGSQTLNDEGLVTFMTEVEAILNSRPLVPVMYDDKGQKPLTPNHLLLFKGNPNLLPGFFDKKHCCTCRRWAQIQHMSNQFWCRWIKEFLTFLRGKNGFRKTE